MQLSGEGVEEIGKPGSAPGLLRSSTGNESWKGAGDALSGRCAQVTPAETTLVGFDLDPLRTRRTFLLAGMIGACRRRHCSRSAQNEVRADQEDNSEKESDNTCQHRQE